jgi:anti-sigma regulatory factor (Ser/Thr protein kinase)
VSCSDFHFQGHGWRERCHVAEQTDPPPKRPQADATPWEWAVDVPDALQATRVRPAFRNYLLRYATAESDVAGAELIFGELLGNVVRYAPGPISFRLDWHANRPVLLVSDEGGGFREVPHGTLDDPYAESGRGLALVRALAGEILMGNRPNGGAYVSAVLPVRRWAATA